MGNSGRLERRRLNAFAARLLLRSVGLELKIVVDVVFGTEDAGHLLGRVVEFAIVDITTAVADLTAFWT